MKKMFNKKFFLILGSAITLLIVLSVAMIFLTKENIKTFSKEGYIIASGNEATTKYYFEEGTSYKQNISSQLVFTDTSGDKVTVDTDNFMHYLDGGIKFLKNGVIMDLNSINNSTVPYYNITDKSVLEYSQKSYYIETLDKTLGFNNIVGRISDNKYIFAGVNVKVQLAGNENLIEGDYFEVKFIEDGIIRVENQEVSYQTTAENSYILVDDSIRIDLGNKKIYYNGEEKMSLSQMTIDGNENIEIVPEEEDKGNGEGEGTGDGTGNEEQVTPQPGISEQPGNDTEIPGDDNETEEPGIGDEEPGQDEPGTDNEPEEPGSDEPNEPGEETNPPSDDTGNEGTGDGTSTGSKRSATIEMTKGSVDANSISASFTVHDPDKAITGELKLSIVNADTGKEVYKLIESNERPFRPQFDMGVSTLSPDTNYILTIAETTKTNREIQYFQKLFRTESLGIKLEKKYATQDSLAFEVLFEKETDVKSASVTLLKKVKETEGNETEIKIEPITTTVTPNSPTATFEGLESNTQYDIILNNVIINAVEFAGEYSIYKSEKTLKKIPYLSNLTTSVNDEKSMFTIGVDNVTDDDKSITKYTYYIYEASKLTQETIDSLVPVEIIEKPAKEIEKYDSDEINVKIDEINIKGKTNYRFKVIAEYYDNEKYGEVETILSGNFILSGKPSIEFIQDNEKTTINTIAGTIKLTDVSCTVPMKNRTCYNIPNNIFVEYDIPNYTDEIRTAKLEFDPKTLEAQMEITDLLANYDYSFRVYANVNLFDDAGIVEKYLLGEFTASTKSMDVLDFNWTKNKSTVEDFINVNLEIISPEDSPELGDSLYHMTVNLYSGSVAGELQNGSVISPIKTVQLSGDEVKAFYKQKSIINTLNTFGITDQTNEIVDEETGEITYETIKAFDVFKSLTEGELKKNYTIEITDMYDESFNNKFEPNLGKNYYNFKVDEEFIMEQELESPKITVTQIINENLYGLSKEDPLRAKHKLKHDNTLNPTTVVGYIVDAKADLARMQNDYHLSLKEIIYYACDADKNPNCTIDDAIAKETVNLTEDNETEKCLKIYAGTKFNSADTSLTRGHTYIFKLKISYEKSENDEIITKYYPSTDVKSDPSEGKTPKQNPLYKMYITNTTGNKANYVFEYSDIDNALYEESIYYTIDDELKNTLNKEPETTPEEEKPEQEDSNEDTTTDGEPTEGTPDEPTEEEPVEPEKPKELEIKSANMSMCQRGRFTNGLTGCTFEIDSLSTDSVYKIMYKQALYKKSNAIEDKTVGEYIFDGEIIYDKNTVTYYNATSENDNRLRIILDKEGTSKNYVNRISTYQVTLSAEGVEDYQKVFTSNDVKTCNEEENSYKCLIIKYEDIKEFKTKLISVNVVAYYDNGLIDNSFAISNKNISKELNNEHGYVLQSNNYFNKTFTRANYIKFVQAGTIYKPDLTLSPIGIYYYSDARKDVMKLYNIVDDASDSFTEEYETISVVQQYRGDGIQLEYSDDKYHSINNKLLSKTELGTEKNTFKFNSIIPKITVNTKGLVNGSVITITPTGVDEEILKNEFKEEDGKYYFYLDIYKDEEKTEFYKQIKVAIDLENGTSVELTKYLPDTTYYFEVSAKLLKEKEYKMTQLFDSGDISNYTTRLYKFSTLSPKQILSKGDPEGLYDYKPSDDEHPYLYRNLNLVMVTSATIGQYSTRFELYDVNGNIVIKESVEPTKYQGYLRNLYTRDITPTEESIKNGTDFVFGKGYYTLKVYIKTEVEVSEEHPDGQAELLVYDSEIALKDNSNPSDIKLDDPTYDVTREATNNTLTFYVTVNDTDKVIKNGTYCIELFDDSEISIPGTRNCQTSVLEKNKKHVFQGLSSDTLYVLRITSDIYTNNIDDEEHNRQIIRDISAATTASDEMALGVVGAVNGGKNSIILTFDGGYNVSKKVKVVKYTIFETVYGETTSSVISSGKYIIGKDKTFTKSGLNEQLVIDPSGLSLTSKNSYRINIGYYLDTAETKLFQDKNFNYNVTFK